MEALTRLVSESLARHGFDRPVDYRRLRWSRWFRCESHHSLLVVPSKPGVFAIAEEVMDLGTPNAGTDAACDERSRSVRPASEASQAPRNNHVGTAAPGSLSERSSEDLVWDRVSDPVKPSEARQPATATRHMLAVTQFFEDDDMAFVLDRMLSQTNPMRARLLSGQYFVRFVVIEDQSQRQSIWGALNQWMVSATEKATGIGSHFATSLELTPASEYTSPAESTGPTDAHVQERQFVEERRFSAALKQQE